MLRIPRPNSLTISMRVMQKTISDCLRYLNRMMARMYWPMMLDKVPRRRYLGNEVRTKKLKAA